MGSKHRAREGRPAGQAAPRSVLSVPESRVPSPESRSLHLTPGTRVHLRFEGPGGDGLSYGRVGRHVVTVPYAIPGEEALVEIVEAGARRARGRLVALTRTAPISGEIRCRHFGRCGGCQWQHLDAESQRRHKTQMVRAALAGLGIAVGEAVGDEGWGFRNVARYAAGTRDGAPVLGLRALTGDRLVEIGECPVQHPANVAALRAVRAALARGAESGDAAALHGLRAVTARVGHGTGEAMVVLHLPGRLADRTRAVQAMLDRVPGMVSLYAGIGDRPGPDPAYDLLWGRRWIEERAGGLRLALGPGTPFPPNSRALPLLLDAVTALVEPDPGLSVACVGCGGGLLALHLARAATFVAGLTDDLDAAWESARRSGVDRAAFYARSPARALAKLAARGHRFGAAVVELRGGPPDADLLAALTVARRVVAVGHSLPVLASFSRALIGRGYRAAAARPVDLLPHTGRVEVVVRYDRVTQ